MIERTEGGMVGKNGGREGRSQSEERMKPGGGATRYIFRWGGAARSLIP